MARHVRAVVDSKDLGEAIDRIKDKLTPGPGVGRALSYPARKLYETVTGKEIGPGYNKGGAVKNPFAKGGVANYGTNYRKRS